MELMPQPHGPQKINVDERRPVENQSRQRNPCERGGIGNAALLQNQHVQAAVADRGKVQRTSVDQSQPADRDFPENGEIPDGFPGREQMEPAVFKIQTDHRVFPGLAQKLFPLRNTGTVFAEQTCHAKSAGGPFPPFRCRCRFFRLGEQLARRSEIAFPQLAFCNIENIGFDGGSERHQLDAPHIERALGK